MHVFLYVSLLQQVKIMLDIASPTELFRRVWCAGSTFGGPIRRLSPTYAFKCDELAATESNHIYASYPLPSTMKAPVETTNKGKQITRYISVIVLSISSPGTPPANKIDVHAPSRPFQHSFLPLTKRRLSNILGRTTRTRC